MTFQFDTGSSNSFFYENPYTYLTNKYDDLPFSIDSSKRVSFDDSQTGYVLSNVQLNSNGKPLTPRYFTLLRDYGENIADSTEVKSVHLGTIGTDILENAYLLIDFPNEQLAIVDSLPESMYEKTEFLKASWNPFKLTMIHVKVNGKKKKAIFDTGSSSWTMITMKSEFEQNYGDPQNVTDTFYVSSWGKEGAVYESTLTNKVEIGSFNISEGSKVYFMPDTKRVKKIMRLTGMSIVIGNALFTDRLIILDHRASRKRLGLVKL